MSIKLSYTKMADNYLNISAPEVYKTIGGKVFEAYESNPTGYANACALRLSRSLNYAGHTIKKNKLYYQLTGLDKKYYFLRVKDVIKYIKATFGKADIMVEQKGSSYQETKDKKIREISNISESFSNEKGILIFDISGWSDASGHATIWSGLQCGDHCYWGGLEQKYTVKKVMLWKLES